MKGESYSRVGTMIGMQLRYVRRRGGEVSGMP